MQKKHDLDAPEKAGEDVHEEGEGDHQNSHLADCRPHSVCKFVSGHTARTAIVMRSGGGGDMTVEVMQGKGSRRESLKTDG